jgi:hypothetical protein
MAEIPASRLAEKTVKATGAEKLTLIIAVFATMTCPMTTQ